MFRREDFILYIPMRGNANDRSINGYSGTNTGATLSTNPLNISSMGYLFDADSDRIDYGETCGDAVTDKLNDGITILFDVKFNTLSSGQYAYIINRFQGGSTANRSFGLYGTNVSGSYKYTFGYEGASGSSFWYDTALGDLVPNVWQKLKLETTNNGSNVTTKLYINSVEKASGTNDYFKETATDPFRIGAQQTNDKGKFGNISNLMIFNRKISSTEEAYINQFGNYKEVA